MSGLRAVVAAMSLLLASSAAVADGIWIEGEAPVRHDFKKHGWYDAVRKEIFSGGEWLSHYDQASPATAVYALEVKSGGAHVFWLRCNPFRVDMDYRLDGGEWRAIGMDGARDSILISPRPDHRFIGWVRVGELALAAGRHELELRIRSRLSNHGGIDCIAIVDDAFVPSGVLKPGDLAAVEAGPADWFAIVPDVDAFSERSAIDMIALADAPAGKHGFLERDGAHLRFSGSRSRVKFWGAGANVDTREARENDRRRVRWLVKHGVDMVRQHTVFDVVGPLAGGKLDPARLDRLDAWFAELKKQGVYSTWSLFYPLRIGPEDGYPPELYAELDRGGTYGLVNISRPLQDLQIAWARKLLEHRNPYTGLRYRDDPALAVLEVHNEDCVFFHNPLNDLAADKKPEHARLLRRAFCDWARRRYRTDAALQKAWGGKESLAAGELRLYGAWELDGKERHARKGDFIRFLAELQRGFYERREKELRAAGFKGVTVTTAWRSGGAAADPANLYCDTAMDMIDRHNYFGGGAGHHSIDAGEVRSQSHLDRPGGGILASGLYQVEDRPFAMTEWTQSPPNEWKAEIAPLVAFYGMGLQGWDASYHFTNSRDRIGDGWPGLSSYTTDTPHFIGQFPALAFAIRKGHLREGPAAAARRLGVDDLFGGDDPLRQDFTGGSIDIKTLRDDAGTPPAALAVGKVTVSFDGGKAERADLSRFIDADTGIVRSMTGELEWDSRRRLVRVMSPRTQALIGFAGGERHELPGASIDVETKFVSLILTPLDDVPLEVSRRILITALARDRQTGARYSEDGSRLEDVGGPPLLLEPVQARIRLRGAAPGRVQALDIYGVPKGRPLALEDGAFRIDGTHRAYYYEATR